MEAWSWSFASLWFSYIFSRHSRPLLWCRDRISPTKSRTLSIVVRMLLCLGNNATEPLSRAQIQVYFVFSISRSLAILTTDFVTPISLLQDNFVRNRHRLIRSWPWVVGRLHTLSTYVRGKSLEILMVGLCTEERGNTGSFWWDVWNSKRLSPCWCTRSRWAEF